MAEVTGLRSNALPYPCYGVPYGIVAPILDADGDMQVGAAGLDSEVSKNGDTFADCTNEATEIATSSGFYYLLLTGTEMTADVVAVIIKTSTSGAKTTPVVLLPKKLPALRAGTAQAGAAGTITLDSGASAIDDAYNGCLIVAVLDGATEARIITDYAGSTKVASVTPNWNTTPDSDDTFTIYLPDGVQVVQANVTAWLGTAVSTPTVAGVPNVNAKTWNDLATVALPLVPATAGRTLVVDAAGLADANVVKVGPTGAGTAQTANDIGADVDAILVDTGTTLDGRIPAALVGGRMDASVGAMAADVLTAAAIAADAITAAKIAANAITNAKIADDAISAAKIAANAFAAAKFAAGAFDAVWTVAVRVLTANTNLNDLSAAGVRTAVGLGSASLDTQLAALAAFIDNELAQVLAANVSRTGTAQAGAAGTITLDAGASAVDDFYNNQVIVIASGTGAGQSRIVSDYVGATKVASVNGNWATNPSSDSVFYLIPFGSVPGASAPTAAEVADAVWDEVAGDHVTAGTTGKKLTDAGAGGDPWGTTVPGAYGAGTAGKILGDNLNATVSSRASQTSVDDLPTNAELATALGTADDAVLAAIAALNNLSAAGVRTAVGLASANLDTQLGDLPTNAELSTALAAADDAILAAVAALNNLSQANIRTALGLASANLDTQLDALPTAAELATALGTADDAILAAIAALNNLSIANVRTAVGLASANLDTQLDALPTNAELATALSAADDAILAAVAALNNITAAAAASAVRTELAAELAKINNLPEGVKKNTALANFMFKMVDATDHVTGETGLTVTATRSLDGAAFGACANSPVEIGGGIYKILLAAADLNADMVTLRFSAAGADVTEIVIKTEA